MKAPGRSFEEAVGAARLSPWWRAFERRMAELEAEPACDERWRLARRGLATREAEWMRERLPGLPEELRQRFACRLERLDLRDALVLLASMHAMAHYRPFLIAVELLKPRSDVVERKMRADALSLLAPKRALAAHVGPAPAAGVAARVPHAFGADVAGSLASVREAWQRIATAPGEASVAGSVAVAYDRLLREPRAFDYGCGPGALVEVMREDFDAGGGDLFEGDAHARLSPAIAALRAEPEAAVGDALMESRRIVRLPPRPDPAAPPGGGGYAVVTSNGVLEHVIDPRQRATVVQTMVAMLAPGGVLLVNCAPTWLGVDGHHALHPWWGVILHRLPTVRRRYFEDRWREGFTTPVGRRGLFAALGADTLAPEALYPNAARVRQRCGAAAALVTPTLRALGRLGLGSVHYFGTWKRLDAAASRASLP